MQRPRVAAVRTRSPRRGESTGGIEDEHTLVSGVSCRLLPRPVSVVLRPRLARIALR